MPRRLLAVVAAGVLALVATVAVGQTPCASGVSSPRSTVT